MAMFIEIIYFWPVEPGKGACEGQRLLEGIPEGREPEKGLSNSVYALAQVLA